MTYVDLLFMHGIHNLSRTSLSFLTMICLAVAVASGVSISTFDKSDIS